MSVIPVADIPIPPHPKLEKEEYVKRLLKANFPYTKIIQVCKEQFGVGIGRDRIRMLKTEIGTLQDQNRNNTGPEIDRLRSEIEYLKTEIGTLQDQNRNNIEAIRQLLTLFTVCKQHLQNEDSIDVESFIEAIQTHLDLPFIDSYRGLIA